MAYVMKTALETRYHPTAQQADTEETSMSTPITDVPPAVAYRSHVRVEPGAAKLKLVRLPHEPEPVPMGVHGPIAAHYHLAEGTFTPRASTLDYVVGAAAGCLMGTLNGALQARQIPTGDGRLTGEAIGDVEVEDGVLVIRRIRMIVHLHAEEAHRAAAERAIAVYADKCPVYRSLYKAIAISTELDFQS
jgi:uncharacterized OsmC-like protein